MGKKLVIVESPAKAKTINKLLGTDYVVKSSMGHVRDLPIKTLGVDIEDSFKPKYVLVASRKKVIAELKHASESCDTVYLASDPDREGEAIAWHLMEMLKRPDKSNEFFRVQYNEITPRAIKQAFEHPGTLDMNRVNAQQARRILDRIVGYKVSPILWRNIKRGLSAGRVQSVALRLVCEREAEIRTFVPEEYWILGALVRKLVAPLDPFKIKLIKINDEKADIKNSEQAEQVKSDLNGRALKITEIATREINKSAPPPYITSSLQQGASSNCGYSPSRTMMIAQKLYEGVDLGDGPVGLITYMRTDSFTVSQDALQSCREYITKAYGAEYCPPNPNYFKSRSNAQEAHEAIRPTDPFRTPESIAGFLDPSELKVYRLIWRRFVASQMAPAKIDQKTVKVDAAPLPGQTNTYIFHASASIVKFPGYMKVIGEELKPKKEGEEAEEVENLPPLAEGEQLECMEWLADRKETQPPPRYSEASLVKALESNGVGRPSTYAAIISTLVYRTYVTLIKRTLTPTEMGIQVNDLLVATLGDLFNVKFTASMEDSLDEIEKGTVVWTKMLADFYLQFDGWMSKIQRPTADSAIVLRLTTALDPVKEWAPESKSGKRTYSDKKFVESIRKRLGEPGKDISPRQLEALVRIAVRYKDQAPDVISVISESVYAKVLTEPAAQKPSESSLRKLELLGKADLDESAKKFVDSLRARTDGGRSLSDKQSAALNNIVSSNSEKIENFENIKADLELGEARTTPDDESRVMIESLINVKNWHEPVTRGRRVFDDRAFYASLSQHFARKRFLSVRQKAALKKMMERYRDQVVNYEDVMKQLVPPRKEP
jgi:DNA topoisomerase I